MKPLTGDTATPGGLGLDASLRDGSDGLAGAATESIHERVLAEVRTASEIEGVQAVVSFLGARVGQVTFMANSDEIANDVLVPHYYDPTIGAELQTFAARCELRSIEELVEGGLVELQTGVEEGKLAYGGGDVPFIRTSDFGNWELKHDSKQRVSQEVYDEHEARASVDAGDILLVRDGTYLVGTSVLVVEEDLPLLFSGGIYRIRSLDHEYLSPALLLALLNTTIVRRQMRSKQFTRDVIDTLGHRLREVVVPIPKSADEREWIAALYGDEIFGRASLRHQAVRLGPFAERGSGLG